MHISETVLSAPVLLAGAAVAAGGVAYGLKKLDYDRVPQVGIMAGVFFVASMVHVPIGPTSVHLILNGLCGLLLGWAAFPALLVGLFLQAVLFQFGGLTTLGVNTTIMALPAVVCYLLFGRLVRRGPLPVATVAGAACGALAVFLSGILMAACLIGTDEGFGATAVAAIAAHLPVIGIEAVIAGLIVSFLRRVQPKILEAPYAKT